MERDARVGVGDAVDVGGDGWVVEEAMAASEEDSDGESVGEVVEDELAQLYH